ncbi:MAG: ATP-dependent DNA helicase RecG [Planctomycetes bacterium]|nr:ATP-dependent DNA helicase RecG [Planctomycetota bacterium]
MEALELLDIIGDGETSRVQFKEIINSPDQLTAEMAAFCNCLGGKLIIGVKDETGKIVGLSSHDIRTISSMVGNVASNNIKPPVFVVTEVVTVDERKVLIVEIPQGTDKPYYDNKGIVWTKNASDKRRVTDNNEMARLLAEGGNLSADEMLVRSAKIYDLNENEIFDYCKQKAKESGKEFDPDSVSDFAKLLENLHLYKDGHINLAGILLFGKEPQKFKPAFCIKAVSYFGNDISGTKYRSSKDIIGNIKVLYAHGKDFLLANLDNIQKGQGFNKQGILEIFEVAIEELLVNALVHRDYFKNAPIRLLIFDNRVEIISPGKLPNNLSVENIKAGQAVLRNNIIASMGSRILPYRGLGTGISRAYKAHPDIELINDDDGEQFTVKIPRHL